LPQKPPIIAIDARLVGGNSTGDSTYWSGLTAALAAVPSEFRFVLFGDFARPASLPSALAWVHLPSSNSRWWSQVAFPLASRRLGAQVVHVQYSLSPLVRKGGVTTIHDVSFLIGPEWFRPRDRFLLSRTVPASARRAARVITVSESSRREIESLVPASRDKVRVTPLACPDWIQRHDRSEAQGRLRAIGIESPFLLTVGTRWPRKNMQLALDAVQLLPDRLAHKLVVTGKQGWGAEELGARAVATGYVSNELLSDLYSAADLYLAPSRHEGFGLPILEAFRCGCPVICSAGGAFPEVAGDAAIVESSWRPEDWATSIEKLLSDPSTLQDLQQRGREREKQFTWHACAERTLEVYREVIW
jgi:glycosyltransferase involved in cell wall biosynthesis